MPIRTTIWKVDRNPQLLVESSLSDERLLEDMIVAQPRLLSEEWMLIGRQVESGHGGRIDLMAIAPDSSLVLIELKRNRTPRDVVAQTIDYASWVERLRPEEIAGVYARFAPGRNLATDFLERFGSELDEDTLNQSHQIIIVAASLDDSTERILAYLSEREIPINVMCFQVFSHGTEQLLAKTWLLDPVRTQVSAAAVQDGPSEPWNGEYYVSFGDDQSRSWEDAVQYNFISAGGGSWYSRTLHLLQPGDRFWVKVPGSGYVGVGRVTGPVQSATDFTVGTPKGDVPVLEVARRATYLRQHLDDPDRREYFIPVRWLQTVPLDSGIKGLGLFGNQNTVCRPKTPKWRSTVEQLKRVFTSFDD